jgi:predicted nucleic acid-binding protein
VYDVISDTGPILHLHQIGWHPALTICERLVIPDLVAEELRIHGVDLLHMDTPELTFSMVSVTAAQWQAVRQNAGVQSIQPADAQVFVLAEATQFRQLVLTDDLALRQHLEAHGTLVVGSIGVLVRAYSMHRLQRHELEIAMDALFDQSTLHLSKAFRMYVRQLLSSLS